MADGPDRPRRASPPPGTDDVLARLGLTGANPLPGGRAARRLAAEEAERREAGAGSDSAAEQPSGSMAPGPPQRPDDRPAPPRDATGRHSDPAAQPARRGYGTDAPHPRDDSANRPHRPGNPADRPPPHGDFADQPFQDGDPGRRMGGEPPGFGQGMQAARGPAQGRPPAGRPMPPTNSRPPAPGPNGRPARPQVNGRPSPPWNGPNERGELRSNGGPPAPPPPSGRAAARPNGRPPSRPNGQPTQAGRLPARDPAEQSPYGRAGTDGRGPNGRRIQRARLHSGTGRPPERQAARLAAGTRLLRGAGCAGGSRT